MDKGNNWKQQIASVLKNNKLLPNNFTGQVILTFNKGGIRNALRGQRPQPITNKTKS
jgi:hypothetical protein